MSMKKLVILVLLLVPFVLLFIISILGKIVVLVEYAPIKSIEFVNEAGEILDSRIQIGLGEEYTPMVKVFPTNTTETEYTLSLNSKFESIISLSEEGVIKGLSYGLAEVIVRSNANNRVFDTLYINVADDDVQDIQLNVTELTLSVKQKYQIDAIVLPYTALNKNVIYSSSNPSKVSVDTNGLLEVKGFTADPVNITVKSAVNAQVVKTIRINVTLSDYLLVLSPESDFCYSTSVNSFDIMSILKYNEEVITNANEIQCDIQYPLNAGASISGTMVSIANKDQMFGIRVRWNNYISDLFVIWE